MPVTMDYRTRVLGIGSPVVLGPNEAIEMAKLHAHFRKEMAKYPAKFAEEDDIWPLDVTL